jgi:hypothetical protein
MEMKYWCDRRSFLRKSLLASAGSALAPSLEERILLAQTKRGQAHTAGNAPSNETHGLPCGTIGNTTLSRLILGGNLIGGVAHSRDLTYVSELIRSYFTDEKIMETWEMAEECGINTMSAWPSERMLRVYRQYRNERGGRIQWLGHTNFKKESLQRCIDNGSVGIYVCGDPADMCVKTNRLDLLAEAISFIRQNGLFAGIACHEIRVVKALVDAGIDVDFVMKTLHSGNYWSATPKEERKYGVRVWDPGFHPGEHTSGYYHDNIWCIDPDATIDHMRNVRTPWMAFKVLAAGAIHPLAGFKYAFENGADFIHVGMFDFQIREDVTVTDRILSGQLHRARPWMA